MRLAAKLISAILLILIISLVIEGELSMNREISLYRQEAEQNGHLVGHALRTLLQATWANKGKRVALKLLKAANKNTREWAVRWVETEGEPDDRYRPRAHPASWAPLDEGRDLQLMSAREVAGSDLLTYIPVQIGGVRMGALEVSESLSEVDARIAAHHSLTLVKVVYLVVLGGVLIVALGFVFVGRPLKRLIAKAERIGTGDLSGRLVIKGHDEMSTLAASLNEMCEHLEEANRRAAEEAAGRIAVVEQLRHEDRLKTVGLLSSGIAHEMGTPLNVVSGRAGLIAAGKLTAEEIVTSAETIQAQAERMTGIIRELLDFARRPQSKPELVEIGEIIRRTLQMLKPLAAKARARLVFEQDPTELQLVAEPTRIQQVLTNIVLNAIQAMPNGGEVRLSARLEEREHKGMPEQPWVSCVSVTIEDEGGGIAPEALEQLFDPFFTTKDIGQGTGLGLSIAYGIVVEHRGWIEVASAPNKGSRFTVYLPREVS